MVQIPNILTERVSVKNVKLDIGHDLRGAYADIYLDNKKVGYFNDDGYGGGYDIKINKESEVIIADLIAESNLKELMLSDGWDGIASARGLDMDDYMSVLFDGLINSYCQAQANKKFHTKLKKDMDKALCIGGDDSYRLITFRVGKTLKEAVEAYGTTAMVNTIKDKILPSLKNGERILNTNLEELNIKL